MGIREAKLPREIVSMHQTYNTPFKPGNKRNGGHDASYESLDNVQIKDRGSLQDTARQQFYNAPVIAGNFDVYTANNSLGDGGAKDDLA